jgi:hypothetical protein
LNEDIRDKNKKIQEEFLKENQIWFVVVCGKNTKSP